MSWQKMEQVIQDKLQNSSAGIKISLERTYSQQQENIHFHMLFLGGEA